MLYINRNSVFIKQHLCLYILDEWRLNPNRAERYGLKVLFCGSILITLKVMIRTAFFFKVTV